MPLIFDGRPAIVWSSSTLPFLWHSQTSAAPNSNVWSSITSQIQSVCEIALSNQASRCASLCRRSSVFSLVKSLFRMSFKNQFHSSVQNVNISIRKQTNSWWLLLQRVGSSLNATKSRNWRIQLTESSSNWVSPQLQIQWKLCQCTTMWGGCKRSFEKQKKQPSNVAFLTAAAMTLMTIRSTLIRRQLQVFFKHGSSGEVRDFQRCRTERWSRRDSEPPHCNLPCLLPSATCFALLFIFLRHRANMKVVCWPLYPARFQWKGGKLGDKDSVPGSLPARLGRSSTATKGQLYLHGDATAYLLKSAELKRWYPRASHKIHKHHFKGSLVE